MVARQVLELPVAQQVRPRVSAVADVDEVLLEADAHRRGAHAVAGRVHEGALVHGGVRGPHRRDERVLAVLRGRRVAGLERVDDRAHCDIRGDLARRVTAHAVAHDVHAQKIVVVHRVLVLRPGRTDVGATDGAEEEPLDGDGARLAHR